MAQPPVPRSSRLSPAIPGSGTRRQPGSIDYTPADAVGFDQIPRAVVEALGGVLLGPPLAADAEQPVARRKADGTYYQHAKGWWVGGDRYVTIDARRLLAPAEGQSLRPITGWKIDGTINHFAPGAVPVNSQWRFDPGDPGGSGKQRRPSADDPLDVLPDQLIAPIRGAEASAWREYGRGWAEETIVAVLATHGRCRVLKAQRSATSRRALESADWHAVTLDAVIGFVQPIATDPGGRVLVGPAVRPTQLGGGSSPTDATQLPS